MNNYTNKYGIKQVILLDCKFVAKHKSENLATERLLSASKKRLPFAFHSCAFVAIMW